MKKIYSLLLMVCASYTFGQTILSENFGTPTATTTIANYVTGTAPATFQSTAPITFSGTGSVRSSAVSSGYIGASGGGNGYLGTTTTPPAYIQIGGINTSGYIPANIQFTFGYWTYAVPTTQMKLEYSTDGTNWTNIAFLNNTVAGWSLVTIPPSTLPASSSLSLKFSQTGTTDQFRIDDIKIIYVNPSCTFALGTPTTACNTTTYNIDTYTATIPYTGGGNGTYTVTSTTGTVAGNNPTTVANGNIIINGVTEGSSISVHAVGVTCDWTLAIPAKDCKPINTLPYVETFPYTAGTALGASQKWEYFSAGADITVSNPSLTYAGYPSADNAVTMTGSGNDCITPFTDTTAGTIYVSFLLKVNNTTNITTFPIATYFAAFTKSTPSYQARLFLNTTSATAYQIGLEANASTTTNFDTTSRNVGDTLLIVMSYNFSSKVLSAWINPTSVASTATATPTLTSTSTAGITDIGGFALRQDLYNSTPNMTIDEIRIATNLTQLLSNDQFNSEIAGLKIYPNPVTNGTLFVDTTTNGDKSITIFDLLGKQVFNTTTSSNSINIGSINTGLYIIKVTEDGKTSTSKLMIK
jgi:hypothetical protein